MNSPERILTVSGLHKKFCRDIKRNMRYGITDILQRIFRLKNNYFELRPQEFWALKDVSFHLDEGEILGIVGTNGSGKTSLMRIIAKIYPNEAGTIDLRPNIRTTAIFALQAGMKSLYSGRENVYLKAAIFGMSKEEVEAKMPFISDFSELGDAIDMPFGNYSSGMKARLAFAVAIASEPNLFIMDETLAVGDSVFKTKCFEYLKAYVKEKPGRGILFVSNNVRKILKVANRTVVMQKGEIIYNSTDLKEALQFYILNCLKHLDKKTQQEELRKVMKYDF